MILGLAIISLITVFCGWVQGATLSLDKSNYAPSENIVATFSGGPFGSTDWVGIYRATDTPGVQYSYQWQYTGDVSSGTQTYNISEVGSYFACLFCCDGYDELTPRVPFTVSISTGQADPAQTIAYVPDGAVGHLGKILIKSRDTQGTFRTQGGDTVTGSVSGANTATLNFTDHQDGTYTAFYTPQLTGSDTVEISINGTILGQSPYTATVHSGFSLKIMSYNVWRSDLYEWDAWRKDQTIAAIQEAGADVVCLNEVVNNSEQDELITGLGFYGDYTSRIISRYPIIEQSPNGLGVKIELPTGQQIYAFNVHMGLKSPWGIYYLPYAANSGSYTEAQLIAYARENWDENAGTPLSLTIQLITSDTAAARTSGKAIFLAGDFNEPSHLDWTQAAKDAGVRPMKVNCPLSNEIYNIGFIDSFRSVRPDEVNDWGHTWTPGSDSIHDRIDFVYYQGDAVLPVASEVVGENAAKAEVITSPWPSDHRAVVSSFIVCDPAFDETPVVEVDAWEGYDYNSTLADHAANPGGGAVTFTKVAGPDWLTIASDGTLSGIPANANVGTNNFTVQASNAQNGTSNGSLRITVANTYTGQLGLLDFAELASRWLESNCVDTPPCSGTDLNGDGDLTVNDLMILSENWLNEPIL